MMSHNHSILVIEDDEALNEQLRLALESRSHGDVADFLQNLLKRE
jgi:ActR/RegA family two-component response regulator